MKNKITKILLSLLYGVPFVFLAMNEDALYGTCWFYLVMIVGMLFLSFLCAKTKNILVLFIGNAISFVSSCIFAWNFQTPKWEYYFKPFLPNQLIIFETVVAIVVQGIVALCVITTSDEE